MIEYSAWGVDYARFVSMGYKLCWVKYYPETFGASYQFVKPVVMLVGYTDTFNLKVPKPRARVPLWRVLPREHVPFSWPSIDGAVTRWGLIATITDKPLIHPCGHRLMTQEEVNLIFETDKSQEWLTDVIDGDQGWAIDDDGEVYSIAGEPKVIDVTKLRVKNDWDHNLPPWCLT